MEETKHKNTDVNVQICKIKVNNAQLQKVVETPEHFVPKQRDGCRKKKTHKSAHTILTAYLELVQNPKATKNLQIFDQTFDKHSLYVVHH